MTQQFLLGLSAAVVTLLLRLGAVAQPLSLCGTERIERRGLGSVMLWGRILLLTWKLHFLLNPLHFDVHLVSSPLENGLARVGWLPGLNFTGELDAAVVNQGSHAVFRCGMKLNMGSLFPNALSGVPTRMC